MDNPDVIRPVTPIETGEEDLVIPDNLPQENPPIASPAPTEVLRPVVLIPVSTLQVIIPTPVLNALTM